MPSLLDLRRTAAALVAVAMSAALIAFALIISDSLQAKVTENARASVGDADVVVLAGSSDTASGRIPDQAVREVSAAGGVASVRPYVDGGVQASRAGTGQESGLIVLNVPKLTGGTRLTEGRLPQTANEIAVAPAVLERQQGVNVGSTLSLKASKDASPHNSQHRRRGPAGGRHHTGRY